MINTIFLTNSMFQHILCDLKSGIRISLHVSEIVKRHLSIRPFHLNVIEAACHGRFKETGHSLVLADMLRHPVIQRSFLERFLNLEYNYLAVTAETDRVDVALKGEEVFVKSAFINKYSLICPDEMYLELVKPYLSNCIEGYVYDSKKGIKKVI